MGLTLIWKMLVPYKLINENIFKIIMYILKDYQLRYRIYYSD